MYFRQTRIDMRYLTLLSFVFTLSIWGQKSTEVENHVATLVKKGETLYNEDLKGAQTYFKEASKLVESTQNDTLFALTKLKYSQFLLLRMDNFEEAVKTVNSLKVRSKKVSNPTFLLSQYHNGLGVIYYNDNIDRSRSSKEFKTAYNLLLSEGLEIEPRLTNNYGLSFLMNNKADSALYFFQTALRSVYKNSSDRKDIQLVSSIHSNIGVSYIYLDKLDSAEFYFKKNIELSSKTKNTVDDFAAFVYLGVFYQEQNNTNEALRMLKIAEKNQPVKGNYSLKALLEESFSDLYFGIDDFKNAFTHKEKELIFKDSIRMKGLEDQAYVFDYKVQIEELQQSRKVLSLESNLKSETLFYRTIVFLLLLLFLGLTSFFIINRLNKSRLINEMKAANEELERKRIQQQAEIDLLRKEEALISANVELSVKSNEFKQLKGRLEEHLAKSHDPNFDDMRHFLKQVKQSEKKIEQLKYLDDVVSSSSAEFYTKIKRIHPNLTDDDVRLSTLIRLNLTSEELSSVFNISISSVMTKRYRLRKKLSLQTQDSLEEYIKSL